MHRSSSSPQRGGGELCLRFECQGCNDLLFLPVDSIRRVHRDRCPKCHQPVRVPPINEATAGYRRIVPKVKAKVVDCPKCAAPLRVPPSQPGKRDECPACRTSLIFQLVPETPEPQRKAVAVSPQAVPPTPAKSSPHAATDSPLPVASASKQSAAKPTKPAGARPNVQPEPASKPKGKPITRSDKMSRRSAKSTTPPPAAARPTGPDTAEPVIPKKRQTTTSDEASHVTEFNEPAVGPAPLVYSGQSASAMAGRSFFDLSSSPRLVWRLIYFALWLGPPFMSCGLFVLTLDNRENLIVTIPLAVLSWGWLTVGWRVCPFLADILSSAIITTFRCPGCGEHHEAVGRWTCGCGYTDHRERHALAYKCPKCRERLGYFDCMQCGSTILFR